VESTSNEVIVSSAVDLVKYRTIIWILGEESTKDHTFDATEQAKVEQFIAGGGNLLVSGSEIGWDLDHKDQGRSFFRNTLGAKYVTDDADTYQVTGASGSIFADLPRLTIDNGTRFYDVDFPDVIAAESGSQVALNYSNGAGAAGLQVKGTGGRGSIVFLGFPFETITAATERAALMHRVLEFFRARN
jgi:hypothetical protein